MEANLPAHRHPAPRRTPRFAQRRPPGGDLPHRGRKVFALLDRCPHKGGPLSQGIVFGESVACPLHNWSIGLADGCAKSPDEGCTPAFACKVDSGQVFLDADELASKALDLPAPVAGPCGKATA